MSRLEAQSGDVAVQVLGIDPTTLARVVRWRSDAAEYPLAELLRVLAVDDMEGAPLPAIVVGGPLPSTSLVADGDVEIDITPVTTAAFFPGKTSVPLVVVNRNALAADDVPSADEVWLRDPPPDATQRLAAAGVPVRGSQGVADVIDTGSWLGVRWSLHAIWAFAVVVGVAAWLGVLLIVASRRANDRQARALGRQMGEHGRDDLLARSRRARTPHGRRCSGVGALLGWGAIRAGRRPARHARQPAARRW